MNLRSQLSAQPLDKLQVVTHRAGLIRTRQALSQDRITVGFLGGSITAGWDANWPSIVLSWFAEQYPQAWIAGENAGIGATGSDSGCLRVDREIIQRGCDLTFVEYAANDHSRDPKMRSRAQEGLIRKLLDAGQDVVLVYTYCQEMYADMTKGLIPPVIREMDLLAEHYALGAVWVGLHALNQVRVGRMKWEEWLPDCLHPSARGSWSYAEAVTRYLQVELSGAPGSPRSVALPEPLYPLHWQSAAELPLTAVRLKGPWLLKRINSSNHVDRVWETHTPGAQLGFDFVGRGLVLIFDYGKKSSEFVYRLDGGEWVAVVRERPTWSGDRGMVRALLISDELDHGPHTFEMLVEHGDRPECRGTECRLAQIAILS